MSRTIVLGSRLLGRSLAGLAARLALSNAINDVATVELAKRPRAITVDSGARPTVAPRVFAAPAIHATTKTRRHGENRAQHRARVFEAAQGAAQEGKTNG